jgi:hypothetical protein
MKKREIKKFETYNEALSHVEQFEYEDGLVAIVCEESSVTIHVHDLRVFPGIPLFQVMTYYYTYFDGNESVDAFDIGAILSEAFPSEELKQLKASVESYKTALEAAKNVQTEIDGLREKLESSEDSYQKLKNIIKDLELEITACRKREGALQLEFDAHKVKAESQGLLKLNAMIELADKLKDL